MSGSDTLHQVAAWWHDHGTQVIIGAVVLLVVLLVVSYLLARRRPGGTPRWVAAVAWVTAMGVSLDSAWLIATTRLHLPGVLAACVFALGEMMMINAMAHAAEQYRRTGHPGRHGRTVWLIALALGLLAGAVGTNTVEHALRFGVPLGIANMWWDNLTAAGTVRRPGRWAWSPRRLAERLGLLVAEGDADLAALDRQRRVRAMVRVRVAVADGAWSAGWPVIGATARLRRLARAADDSMMAEVQAGVTRSVRVVDLTAPNLDQTRDQTADQVDQVKADGDQVDRHADWVGHWAQRRLAVPLAHNGYAVLTDDLPPGHRDQVDDGDELTLPASDEALLVTYGGALRGLRDDGKLSRYKVEQVTGCARRQADRLLDALRDEVEATRPT